MLTIGRVRPRNDLRRRGTLLRIPARLLLVAAVLGLGCGDGGPLDGGAGSAGAIVGEVTLDGIPRAGAGVTARLQGAVVATASTDEGGDYEFLDLDPGTYGLTVSIAGAECPGERTVVLPPDDQIVINFSCSTPGAGLGSLSGLVVGGTGFGVLVLRDPAGTIAAQGIVGEGGEFNFSDIAPGAYLVRVLPPNSANVACPDEAVTVRAGETATVSIVCG
jgi:hypothetical protein